MPGPRSLSRRRLLRLGSVALAGGLAGCQSGSGSQPTTTTLPPTTTTRGPCPKAFPDPPERVTADTAKEFARRHEEIFAYNFVCEEPEFGLSSTTASKEVAVEYETEAGIFVFAQQPMWSADDNSVSDGATSAIYFVGNSTAVRVPYYGAEQLSVPTYTAPEGSGNANAVLGIRLFNFTEQERTLTISLDYTGGSSTETAFEETYSLPPTEGIRLLGVAERDGTYELTVDDGSDQSIIRQLRLGEEDANPVAVYIGPTGHIFIASVPTPY